MFRSLLLLATAATVLGQDTTAITSSAPSASTDSASSTASQPFTHTINVGKAGHTFEPDIVQANVGDVIQWNFYPTNHSVIRAEYQYPCVPYEDTGVDKVGFFSGFKPVDAILASPPTFTLTVNDTNPVFYYCGATGSCTDFHMVGVINPNASTSLQTQKDLAGKATFMLLPGQPWPDEASAPNPMSTSTLASHTATETAAPAATTSATSDHHHQSLSAGAIAGIAIGASAVAVAAAALLFLCGRHSRRLNNAPQSNQPLIGHQAGAPFSPQPHMAYAPMDPTKHMSMHSSMASPALPGYMPSPDHASYSPQMGTYAPSDALNPGHLDRSPNASPHQMPAAPSYAQSVNARSSMGAQSFPSSHHHSFVPIPQAPTSPPIQHNIHEMSAGPVPEHGLHHVAPADMPYPSQSPSVESQQLRDRASSVGKGGQSERYQ